MIKGLTLRVYNGELGDMLDNLNIQYSSMQHIENIDGDSRVRG